MMRQHTDAPPVALDFGALLDRHQASLLAFLRGLVPDAELARDLVQDVFCDAWRAAARGAAPFVADSSDGDRRNWLFHAAYCRAISARRHMGVLRWESLDAGPAPLREQLEAPWRLDERLPEQDAVRAALASLAADDAACLLLNVLHGFVAAEIAAILDLTPDAAKKRLSRAKQRLRAAYLAQNPERQEVRPHDHD
jgi:RNA polymerase sigma-70 factor (ECF subfamily)